MYNLIVLLLLLLASPALAQNTTCATRPLGDSSNACASTAFIAQGVQTQGVSINVNPYTPPVTFPGTQPFGIQETVTGTCTTGANNCYYNFINIPSDNAVVGPGNTGSFVIGEGFFINHTIGGAAMTGNRVANSATLSLTSTTGNTAANASYSAAAFLAQASANDNGTSTVLANSRGQIEGVNFVSRLTSGATNFRALQGGEVDVSIAAGASAYEKVGWQIVQLSTDAVAGAIEDAALVITNQAGAVGWSVAGIQFGGALGAWPFQAGATAIKCSGACGSLTSVLDFSSATISGNFLSGPGFSVNGTGQISSGAVGGSLGRIQFNGTTSGSGAITVGATGTLSFSNNQSGGNMVFNDAGNGTMFVINPAGGTVAGRVNVTAATTGVAPSVSVTGSDTNISLNLVPKGTGVLQANGTNTLSVTKTVRASGGAADCTLIFVFGMLTGGSC